jgi:aromatic-L-amino-acid decarboxylase
LAFKLAGARAFREQLEEKLDLARWAADQLRALPDVEVVAEPQLSLLAFRVVRPGLSEADTNALNRKALDAVNRRGRVYITGTTVAGRYLMRICVLSFRTHMERMEQGLEDIRQVIENDGR